MTLHENGFTLEFEDKNFEQANSFFKLYKFSNIDFASTEPMHKLLEPKVRTCRYCGNSSPKVTFNKKAHTIPEFLGNKESVSDFECDKCNLKFSRLELDFANFIGPSRALNGTLGKNGIPNLISGDNKIVAKPIKMFENINGIAFGNSGLTNEGIKYNSNQKHFEIKFRTQKFKPFNVYKSFLKLALGLINQERVQEFKSGFDLLQDKSNKNFISNQANRLISYTLENPYSYTSIILFESIDKTLNVPPLCLVFLYDKFMYQISIPYSSDFLRRMDNEIIFAPFLPPILPTENLNCINYFEEIIELDSLESQSRDLLTVIKDEIDLETMIAIDKDTGIQKDYFYDPNNVSQFIQVKKGTAIPIKKG